MPKDPALLTRKEKARYYVENLALRTLIGGIGLLPYEWRVPMMGRIMRLAAPVAGYDKRVRENLALTSPQLSPAEVNRITAEVCDNVGRTLSELYAGAPFRKRAAQAQITGDGFAAFEAARAAGRPVVLVTAHFGNYDAARSKLTQMGHPMGSLYRRMANPYFNAHYVEAIEATGKPMFEQGKRGMVELVRHLKKGGIIAIVADVHTYGGVELPFFGQAAETSLVPAELALKYNAAFIPVYGIRKENGLDFEVRMNAEVPASDAETMTRAVLQDLEEVARDHMGQWFWIHRRWKAAQRKAG
ncbi:Lipid A biosynthesis lauroyl acyltransferase [Tritonibacter multivorans]|uniref:Lipid A biosynthesis lauroyl acyltransferase n=1 Tax=Tritonibacter multivorans TaxID=928856 RepID=A0A0P1GIE7_9RHOB|nr:lysophospholipid acyltransferase family protein [Tritonibacter multivorans]MDA7420479.1 lysophospholipid acyltransferase family protein [Tritonibacter multivorans]CUH81519.1 Lipid A biosynthesis lauroyl acyltransferase [Tritonibacter multivorans]SFC37238.1 KDO2-lipid IV(A) lauroyltransferase [Tritonibacter multivorans]